MFCWKVHLLWCVLFFITLSSSEILQPPENNTLFLDQTAEFMCEIDSDTLVWKINGTERSNTPPEIRTDLVVRETITSGGSTVEDLAIPAKAEYNGTLVQCIILSTQESQHRVIMLH